jgi:hypothetical protein
VGDLIIIGLGPGNISMKTKIKGAMTAALVGAIISLHAFGVGEFGAEPCEPGVAGATHADPDRRYQSNLDGPLVAFLVPAGWAE